MLKWIFASLLITASWGVVVYFELPYWIAGIITTITASIIGLIYGIRFAKSRKASKEIERALKAQAEEQARSARPDLEADIRSMQEEFTRAINALKSSRLGAKGATSALYSLPWYVIVGPPGVGKSTALRNSGLKFPFSSNRGGVSVQGVGGTRNCEWWMTSDAVILDTAGRYTTENADRDEWFAFLDLLRKYRTRRPINGVLAAVSVADIAEAHPEEVAGLAREIRARIDELQDRLGVVVPVYMLFTKCDLLPGFVEMFSDLSEAERHQIWGFTLKVSDQLALADQTGQHLDEMSALLEKRALRRLAEERSMARRERLHELSQYFASLREPMARFVHELTEPNIYHETPILRGVYMTSGTQEGRPLGRIMSSIAEAFGLRPTIGGATVAPVDAKSYFLGEIFRRVIFPDYALVRHNRRRTRKLRIGGTIAGAVSLVSALAIVGLPFMSYRYNRELLGQAGSSIAYIEQHVDQDTVDVIPMDRIEPLRRMVETLQTYEEEGAPWSMRMGMYQGSRMYPRLRDVFADTVRRELLIPIAERELETLDSFVRRYTLNNDTPTIEEYEENFARLRMYLLTTQPPDEFEPGLDEAESAWLSNHLGNLWEAPILVSGEPTSRESIDKVASTYVRLLASRSDLAFARDTDTVARAREVLSRVDRTKALTNHLVESVTGPALSLRDMVGVSALQNDNKRVRPAFTKKGFERVVKPLFEDGLEELLDPPWVLADGDGEAAKELQDQEIVAIKTSYYRMYIDEWRAFVDSVYVVTPKGGDFIDTLGLLTELVRTEPYKLLFENVAWHTTLFDPQALEAASGGGPGGGNKVMRELQYAGENMKTRVGSRALAQSGLSRAGVSVNLVSALAESAVTQREAADPNTASLLNEAHVYMHFKPLTDFGAPVREVPNPEGGPPKPPPKKPLDEYHEQVRYVRDALQARLDDPSQQKKEQASEKLKGARSKTKALLAAEKSNTWAPTLDKLLTRPLDLAIQTMKKDISGGLQKKGCNNIQDAYAGTLAKRYPFNRDGEDVALSDLSDFYHPESGALWEFYDKVLETPIPRRGKTYTIAESGSSDTKYNGTVVDFLNASRQIADSMYPRGSKDPKVELEVTIQGSSKIKEVSFTLDGETVRYRNGPLERHEMTWPGENSPGARLEVKGLTSSDDISFDGEWGFFRLLEAGKVKRGASGKRSFKAQWDFSDEELGLVQITFQARSVNTPFFGLGGSKPFMSIFRTKKVEPPRAIVRGGGKCPKN